MNFVANLLFISVIYSVYAVSIGEDYDYEYSEYNKKPAMASEDLNLMKPNYNIKDAPQLFENFIKTYNKQYKDEAEKNYRYKVFLNTLESIIDTNKNSKTQSADINQFADLDDTDPFFG